MARTPDNYTAFRKEVEARAKVRPEVKMPEKLKPVPELGDQLRWGDTPTYQQLGVTEPKAHPCSAFPFQGGETSGLQRLQSYLWDTDAVARYKGKSNEYCASRFETDIFITHILSLKSNLIIFVANISLSNLDPAMFDF